VYRQHQFTALLAKPTRRTFDDRDLAKSTRNLRSAATSWSTGVAREGEALVSMEANERVARLPIPWRERLTPVLNIGSGVREAELEAERPYSK